MWLVCVCVCVCVCVYLVLTTACSGPQTQHHLASILAEHYKIEDINFAARLAEP